MESKPTGVTSAIMKLNSQLIPTGMVVTLDRTRSEALSTAYMKGRRNSPVDKQNRFVNYNKIEVLAADLLVRSDERPARQAPPVGLDWSAQGDNRSAEMAANIRPGRLQLVRLRHLSRGFYVDSKCFLGDAVLWARCLDRSERRVMKPRPRMPDHRKHPFPGQSRASADFPNLPRLLWFNQINFSFCTKVAENPWILTTATLLFNIMVFTPESLPYLGGRVYLVTGGNAGM
jgi:hypothetical protein